MRKSALIGAVAAVGLALGTPGRADAQIVLSFGSGGFASPYGYGVPRGFGGVSPLGFSPYTYGRSNYGPRYGNPYPGNRAYYGSPYRYSRPNFGGYSGYRGYGNWNSFGRRFR